MTQASILIQVTSYHDKNPIMEAWTVLSDLLETLDEHTISKKGEHGYLELADAPINLTAENPHTLGSLTITASREPLHSHSHPPQYSLLQEVYDPDTGHKLVVSGMMYFSELGLWAYHVNDAITNEYRGYKVELIRYETWYDMLIEAQDHGWIFRPDTGRFHKHTRSLSVKEVRDIFVLKSKEYQDVPF